MESDRNQITEFGQRSFVAVKGLKERIQEAENRPYWKCTKCGLELTFEEVCQSGGHNCKEDTPDLMEQENA